jgi:hypothetical protein
VLVVAFPSIAWADDAETQRVARGGIKGVWVLGNISYAGMRAQGNPARGWRILAFVGGFPGTLLSYLAVAERSNRAYGIVLPDRDSVDTSGGGKSRRHERATVSHQ